MEKYALGNVIYEQRKKKGLSQRKLGVLVGVTNKAVSKWEVGENLPKTEILYKLARIFNLSIDEMVFGTASTTSQNFIDQEITKASTMNLIRKKQLLTFPLLFEVIALISSLIFLFMYSILVTQMTQSLINHTDIRLVMLISGIFTLTVFTITYISTIARVYFSYLEEW